MSSTTNLKSENSTGEVVDQLRKRIQNREITVGIIGLGYVGLPLAIRFLEEGFPVIGFDIDDKKVEKLNAAQSYIKHIQSGKIKQMIDSGFRATMDFGDISSADAILICVPTPLGFHNEPDLSFIYSTLKNIEPYLRENQLLILESTTYPGTTEEMIVNFLENNGFKIGNNYFVGYYIFCLRLQ